MCTFHRIKNHTKILFIALWALIVASCSKQDYTSVIPKDATLVAAIQLDRLAEDAQLSQSTAISRIKHFSGLVASGATQEKVNAILDDPSLIGLDFSSPAYLFVAPNQAVGLALRVDDSSQLDEVVNALAKQQLATRPIVRNDCSWTTLFVGVEMAYDDHTALLMLPTTDNLSSAVVRTQMAQYMSQDNGQQFAETDKMNLLDTDAKHPLQLYARATALPASLFTWIKPLLPKGVRASNVEVKASLANAENKTTLAASLFSSERQTDKLLKDADKDLKNIEGVFMGAAPKDFFVWGAMGCKGQKVLSILKENKQTKDFLFLLERGIDIENMLTAVDGDLTIVLPQVPRKDNWEKQEFMLLGQLSNQKFLDDVPEWKATAHDYGISINNEPGAPNHYLLKADNHTLHWGVDNKQLYMASDGAYRQRAFSSNSELIGQMRDEIKNSKWFLCINMGGIESQHAAWGTINRSIESITLSGNSATDLRICITGKEKGKSAMSQLLNHLLP